MLARIRTKYHDITALSRLGWNGSDRLKIIFVYLYIAFIWKINPHDVSFQARLRWKKTCLPIFITSYGDLLSLTEVFVNEEYALNDSKDIHTILDGGAHVGYEALYFATAYPDARIFCCEPDPRTFEKLRQNISGQHNITAHQIGLGGHDATMSFFSSSRDSLASSFKAQPSDSQVVEVEVKTVRTFLKEASVIRLDLLKFDIEGMEVDMLQGCVGVDIRHYIGEIHFDLIREEQQWFNKLLQGYTVDFKTIGPKRAMLEASIKK